MKRLRRLVLLIIILALAFAFYPSIKRSVERVFYPLEYVELIKKGASDNGLDPYLVAAVIYEESKFDPAIHSKAGAIGLMQIMPETGRWISAKKGRAFVEADLLKPELNIDLGCWYLRYLTERYDDEELALAAYNGGVANVDKWLSKGDSPATTVSKIPFKETYDFINRVKESREKYKEFYSDELE